MWFRRTQSASYFLIFVLPVLVVMMLAGALNLLSVVNLRDSHERANVQLMLDLDMIERTSRFNRQLDATHDHVLGMLKAGTSQGSDQAEIYRRHTTVVDQLAVMAQEIAFIEASLHHTDNGLAKFEAYRNFVIMATDIAAIDPQLAYRHAYDAAAIYNELSEHNHAMVERVSAQARERGKTQSAWFLEHSRHQVLIGGGLVIFLLGGWVLVSRILVGHLSAVSQTLHELANGAQTLSRYDAIQAMAGKRSGLLPEMCRAIIAFRAALDERGLAEAKDRDNRELMNAVIETSPYAIEVIDPETLKFIKINDTACRQLGYTQAELMALDLTAIQVSIPREQLLQNCRTVLASDGLSLEGRHRRKDGTMIDVGITVRGFRQGGHDYILALWDDITGDKAAQSEIRKLSLVVEQTPSPVVITDLDGKIEYVNDAFVRRTGFQREFVLGANPRILKSGKTPDAVYVDMWSTLARGETWTGEFINRTRDGREEIEAATIIPLRDETGRTTHYVAVKEVITERRRQEEQLSKLFLAVNQSPESIAITDLDARIEYVNEAFLRNTGYTREEVMGQNPKVLQSGRTPVEVYDDMWATLLRGEPWKGELINRRKDGREYIELAHIAPVRQADGIITHYLAIKEDITEKKKMAEELFTHRLHLERLVAERTAEVVAATEEQQAVFEAASVGIVLVRDRVVIRSNSRLGELFGYEPSEMTGLETRVWYPDEQEWQSAGDEIYSDIGSGKTHIRVQRYVRKDGSEWWARIYARAIDPSNPDRGLVAIIENITEERAAAETLRIAAAEQQAIFDSASSGIVLIKDRILQNGNRRLHEMFGWPPGEMIGKLTRIWYHDEAGWITGGGEVYEQIWRGETHRREQLLMRRDGSLFWARLTARAVDLNDHQRGSVWVIEDISVERAAIDAVQRARAMAEDAARIKSDFLANMSHEIRTPMNAIIGMTYLLHRDIQDQRHGKQLEKISAAAQHLLSIINDILDLSKIEAGKLSIEKVDFDVEPVMETVQAMVTEKAAAKGVELVVDIHELPAVLHGDGLRLGQILLNFASNAVKFTDSGWIAIRGRPQASEDGEPWVRFEVADTGIGLNDEHKGRLFEAFEQADSSITRKYGGTGLGLAISKRLTELMGGRIGVDSEVGHGSTFWIELPFGRPSPAARKRLAGGLRVLVVDDLDTARDALAATLRMLGLGVETVSDGSQAVGAVVSADTGRIPFDVVLVDRDMPGMGGLDVGRAVAAQPLSRQPRLLLLSHGHDDTSPVELMAAGFVQSLHKPATPSRLFDAIQTALSGQPVVARLSAGQAESLLRRRGGGLVLLAEDNLINQEVASDLLRNVGLTVALAENGCEAVEMARDNAYDLILMDMQMPEMDGLTATHQIRAMPGHAATPILAMTANAFDEDRNRCLEAGMNDHIPKPVDPEKLYQSILAWLPESAGKAHLPPTAIAVAETSAPDLGPLSRISGLDLGKGLRSTNGQVELYIRLLRRFVDSHEISAIEAALADSDQAALRLAAHSLKGVAATLGGAELSALAARLESLLVGPDIQDGQLNEAADAVRDEFLRLRAEIMAALPTREAVAIETVVDLDRLHRVADELEDLLTADDIAAVTVFRQHAPLLRAAMGDTARTIERHMDDFAFDEALAVLRGWVGYSRRGA
ncbi:MAG: PAS domain S-box protein [Phaeospirillum sp.]|nr:PAS domain S-box protein [Phaeospirillum sp.]